MEDIVGSGYADTLAGGDGPNVLTGGAGADTFVFNSRVGMDVVTDFASGVDRLRFSQAAIPVGNGDTRLDNAVTVAGPGGFAPGAELVIVHNPIAGAITPASAAAAIGAASSAYAVGATALFAVNNGTGSEVFLFTSAARDGVVSAGELVALVGLAGSASTVLGDYGLVA